MHHIRLAALGGDALNLSKEFVWECLWERDGVMVTLTKIMVYMLLKFEEKDSNTN